jgi:hypothetical protein
VGSCPVLGGIPATVCDLHLYGMVTAPAPSITVLESTTQPGVELSLGLDFLREYQAIVDLRLEELRILVANQEYQIPFVRPRGGLMGLSGGGYACDHVDDDDIVIKDCYNTRLYMTAKQLQKEWGSRTTITTPSVLRQSQTRGGHPALQV